MDLHWQLLAAIDIELGARQAADPTEKGRGHESTAQGATAWTDEEGEADKGEMAAMREEYQWDPAVVEATWETYLVEEDTAGLETATGTGTTAATGTMA